MVTMRTHQVVACPMKMISRSRESAEKYVHPDVVFQLAQQMYQLVLLLHLNVISRAPLDNIGVPLFVTHHKPNVDLLHVNLFKELESVLMEMVLVTMREHQLKQSFSQSHTLLLRCLEHGSRNRERTMLVRNTDRNLEFSTRTISWLKSIMLMRIIQLFLRSISLLIWHMKNSCLSTLVAQRISKQRTNWTSNFLIPLTSHQVLIGQLKVQ